MVEILGQNYAAIFGSDVQRDGMYLGSGLIDHSQKMTVAAMQTAEK